MIRMKAKSLLLSVMLLMVCFCFAGCKDTHVGVERVSFNEKTISLLVGESYSPDIKVLPSYATNRSYTLISDDVASLKVEAGTITALKEAKGIMLKVVSNDNANANSMIVVNIYATATDLPQPSTVSFDGSMFSFVAQDNGNALSYELKIGDNVIDIGNNTQYSFANVENRVGKDALYNRQLECSVRAIGDGKIFKNSAYSTPVSFAKLSSVTNAYVENETLYFDSIAGVGSYTVEVIKANSAIDIKTATNSENLDRVALSISDLISAGSTDGAEYVFNIYPNTNSFGTGVNVYNSVQTTINHIVLGQVKNVAISNRTVSWSFVRGAESYSVELFKDNELVQEIKGIVSNEMSVEVIESGHYVCKVIAVSTQNNTTSGKTYSQELEFTVLRAPELAVDTNGIKWDEVGTEGYLVTIEKDGATIINSKWQEGTSYDIANHGVGTYTIYVASYGNAQNILTSIKSAAYNWTKLAGLQLNIKEQKLYWKDNDASSLHNYNIAFTTGSEDINKLLTTADYGYDDATQSYYYNLAQHNFVAGNYTISLQSIGAGNVFSAETNNINVTKLDNSAVKSIANKVFEVEEVASASRYDLEVYKQGEDTPIENVINANGRRFTLDDSSLTAGSYYARVFTYGNNQNVFDADNPTAQFQFSKLDTPNLNVSGQKLVWNNVVSAEGYALYEKDVKQTASGMEFDVSGLTAGDYSYVVQAIGNKSTVLDSAKTITPVKIKKLAKPTITFDKATLNYTVSSTEADFIQNYEFKMFKYVDGDFNQVYANTINDKADCEAYFIEATQYKATAYANPKASAEYALIIHSEEVECVSSKIDGACKFKIESGKLKLYDGVLALAGYKVKVRIDAGVVGNNADDIILNADINYSIPLFNVSTYEVNTELLDLVQNPKTYKVYATISKDDATVVDSTEVEATNINGEFTVLNRVDSISKDEQNIKFSEVSGASYVAVVKVKGKDKYINLDNEKYTTSEGVNTLAISTLIELLGADYYEGIEYKISFVALSNKNYVMANKGVIEFAFEFLKAPTIKIVEISNKKYIEITNDNAKASKYVIDIEQGETGYIETINKGDGASVKMGLDTLNENYTKFIAGTINIAVKSQANAGNYYDSKNSTITATKIASSTLSVVDGKLMWDEVANAKQYNLKYGGATISLVPGDRDLHISSGVCTYEFDNFASGTSANMWLQVDASMSAGNYLNSNDGEVLENVCKLSTVTAEVKSGEIVLNISAQDIAKIENISLWVDGQLTTLNIEDTEYIKIDLGIVTTVTINPVALLKYGSTTMLDENIEIKLNAKADINALNSSKSSKIIKGLLQPIGLDIVTSNIKDGDVITEVVEKIAWNDPKGDGQLVSDNEAYVSEYEIVIKYVKPDTSEATFTFESTTTSFNMPKSAPYDIDGNGSIEDGEIMEFGPGTYYIKVKAKTANSTNVVNSGYCAEISVILLETPINLSTVNGNLVWGNVNNAGSYIVRIYSYDTGAPKFVWSAEATTNMIDAERLTPLQTSNGIYGITIQAQNIATGSNGAGSKILSSKESAYIQLIRLPQVTKYFVNDGDLYIRVHKFFTKAELYLTKDSDKKVFTITNTDLSAYNTMTNTSAKDWLSTSVLNTLVDDGELDEYYVNARYTGEDETKDGTLVRALAQGYALSVKLYGNSVSMGGIVSGITNSTPTNTNTDTNAVEKLIKPTTKVSDSTRGGVFLTIEAVTYSDLEYYGGLKGVYLYEINIKTDVPHSLYVAQVVNQALFAESLTNLSITMFSRVVNEGLENEETFKGIRIQGMTFNILDVVEDPGKDESGNAQLPTGLLFNFNRAEYYYFEVSKTDLSTIDLSMGGDFKLTARFMGDNTKYLKSDITKEATIRRYDALDVQVAEGSISWKNLKTDSDEPVYVLTLTQGEAQNKHIALYNSLNEEFNDEFVKNCLDASKTYIFDTYEDNNPNTIEYLNLAKMVGNAGSYSISIMAYHTDKTANDKILAQQAKPTSIEILEEKQLTISDGSFKWELDTVTVSDGSSPYITNYKLEIEGAEPILLQDGDYSVSSDGYAICDIERITGLVPEKDYNFKLTTLARDESTSDINSTSSSLNGVQIMPNVIAKMGNGVLSLDDVSDVQFEITYEKGEQTIVLTPTEYGIRSYDLPAKLYGETNYSLPANTIYTIRARLKGDDTTKLNGYYQGIDNDVSTGKAERLATVTNIHTDNGLLKWSAINTPPLQEGVEIDLSTYPVTYSVLYRDADTPVNTFKRVDGLTECSYDFADAVAGDITNICVLASHNYYFTSEQSAEATVYKLQTPDKSKISLQNNTTIIKWDTVFGDNNEAILSYDVSVMAKIEKESPEDAEPIEPEYEYVVIHTERCSAPQWNINSITYNEFEFAIRAVGVGSEKFVVSDYTEYIHIGQPKAVDQSEFVFDSTTQAFKWLAPLKQDNLAQYITYTVQDRDGNTYEYIDEAVKTYIDSGEDRYYYYYPTIIGTYSKISVQIKLGDGQGLASQPTPYNQNGVDTVEFSIFAKGDGSSDKPYSITNEEQLRNINYILRSRTSEGGVREGVHYRLDEDITLTDKQIDKWTDKRQQITDSSIAFNGIFDGNNHYIYGQTAEEYRSAKTATASDFDLAGCEGLFAKMSGATVMNLQLSQFIFKGTWAYGNISLGILTAYAEDSTFQGITITSCYINLSKSTDNRATIYVGAVSGYSAGCIFNGCTVTLGENMDVYVKGYAASTTVYIGVITGCDVKFDNNTSDDISDDRASEFTNNTSGVIDGTPINAYVLNLGLVAVSSGVPIAYVGAVAGKTEVEIDSSNTCYYQRGNSQIGV